MACFARQQIKPLAAAGFRVVAPDTRGYNLSSKPDGVAAYETDKLAADIRDLIRERGAKFALLAGHDWGGTIAWTTAMNHPEVVDRLAILNAAHPRKLSQGLHHPGQLRKSWYFFFFDLPDLPEAVVHADHWHFFRHFLRDARPAYTPEEIDRYVEAWSQPGAAAGMINYYRSPTFSPPPCQPRTDEGLRRAPGSSSRLPRCSAGSATTSITPPFEIPDEFAVLLGHHFADRAGDRRREQHASGSSHRPASAGCLW
jgi:pimeloyl-ACP methyl ester carboxylesterase